PGAGTLSLTSNNVSTTVTGPGVLATVTFNVTGIGDTDITLGPETRLIRIDGSNITFPHQLEHGFFTNGVDLYVQSIVPSPSQVYPTWTFLMEIQVYVANSRSIAVGPFSVTLYNGSTPIETQFAPDLDPFGDRRFTFNWAYTGLDWGLHNITAIITVPNEISPDNNELLITVTIKIPGDCDGDGEVSFDDFIIFAGKYGIPVGQPGYDLVADFNSDGAIDFDDFIILAAKYGQNSQGKYP
ncbi:MAG: hypothetical protein GWO08_06785, partial [Gammaproteobacteria bacterium]|nr:hypothetical protein [Phycisphaerae bacterium]NIR93375.1 hypothetical protein [Gammaproteobacteria bacterium]